MRCQTGFNLADHRVSGEQNEGVFSLHNLMWFVTFAVKRGRVFVLQFTLIPAQAGIHAFKSWIPAYAGMTGEQRFKAKPTMFDFDISAFYWIEGHLQYPALRVFFEFMTDKKNFVIPGAVAGVAILLAYKKNGLAFILTTAIVVAINDAFIHQLIKQWVARPRPCHTLEILKHIPNCTNSFSFPSNHAGNAFALASISSLYFRNRAVIMTAFILALFAALSRVYLGQHYPTDILAGAVLGSTIGFLGSKLIPITLRFLNTWPKIEQWTNPTKNS